MSKKKIRIQYKNIVLTYNNCFEVDIKDFKAFFIDLFNKIYFANKIKYLLIAKNQIDKTVNILLVLEKKPDFKNIDNFKINKDEPGFEPLKGTIQGFKNEIKYDNDFKFLEIGQASTIKTVIKEQSTKDFENEFYNYIAELENRFRYINTKMTTEDAEKEIYAFFEDKPVKEKYKRITEIDRILAKHFTRPENNNHLKDNEIAPLNTFRTDITTLNNIKDDILIQVNKVKQNERPEFISIQGDAKIGKTEFIKSVLKHNNIKFNLILGKLKFENYNDDADVDIFDDSDYFKWDKNDEGIEYAKPIIGCNQKNMTVWQNKYKPLLTIKKFKLSIIICNPGSKSFWVWSKSEKNPIRDYIKQCNGSYYFLGHEKLYITKVERAVFTNHKDTTDSKDSKI